MTSFWPGSSARLRWPVAGEDERCCVYVCRYILGKVNNKHQEYSMVRRECNTCMYTIMYKVIIGILTS